MRTAWDRGIGSSSSMRGRGPPGPHRGSHRKGRKAHARWREDINADVMDILIEMKESERQLVMREKQNAILTWMLSLYRYDSERLQRDITKIMVLKSSKEASPDERKKLLQVLWDSVQILLPEMDYTSLFNDIERMASFHRRYPEDDGTSPFKY